ncbi:MAG TPA: aromatic aminobenezylarsenical efflux permease ArsG family transporter [Victivallales bacterium]|nr:aromatic aminobenezylarsenical efflux permease ArsG family transporter [Victivallales bacterium]HRU02026.1 aromatic aminobenezylarsenical efflux permease ArsG family transporter [Victivallales bacterium]
MQIALFTAFWLGILTAISPCPLATNIAAISYMSKYVTSKYKVFISGLSYSIGRTFAYLVLGYLISSGILVLDSTAKFLQKYMNESLGPLLIFIGMVLLGWIGSSLSCNLVGESFQKKAEKGSILWDFLLGILFAMSFCPASAALFFAGLIPLSLKQGSSFLIPAVYGIATAMPVIFFAFLIAFSAKKVATAFNKLSLFEKWIQVITGVFFILAGIYYCINFNFAI